MSGAATGPDTSLALSVHGPQGVVDLLVPAGASGVDVAREYAAQVGTRSVPALCTRRGTRLGAETSLAESGVRSGALLVALDTAGSDRAAGQTGRRERLRAEIAPVRRAGPPGRLSATWFAVAALLGVLAGWMAAGLPQDDRLREVTVYVLAATAFVGVLPVGRFAAHRATSAPAFAGAAAYAVAYEPVPERLPTILGVSALVAAVTAAVGRALDRRADEALQVWVVTGVACFLVSAGVALVGFAPSVVWCVLLLGAMLATRFVPSFAVDVPDQYLIDIERLAVTAWSARERPRGRRGRIIIPRRAVAAVVDRGTRLVVASSAAVLAVSAVAAPMLLATATGDVDRIGARTLVFFAGATLLLVGRSYRNGAARLMLRLAGLACWLVLAVALLSPLGPAGPTARGWVVTLAIVLAALLVVVAVAVGRGWRSAWWSRRAEVAEGISGAFALASVVVAVGAFRRLWELTGAGLGT